MKRPMIGRGSVVPRFRGSAVVVLSLAAGAIVWAQGRNIGAEWQAAGADAQRTYWQKADPNINADSVSKGGFELQWTTKLDNRARQLNNMSEGVTLNGVGLFWPVSLVAGSSNNLYEIDNDTGNVQWQRHFEATLPAASTAACPGGISAAPARVLDPQEPAPPRAGGGPRGGGYRGAVGQPGEGVPAELSQRGGGARPAAPPAAPPSGAAPAAPATPGAPGARAAVPPGRPGGGGGLGRIVGPGYVISSDGVLHTIGWQNGKEIQKPAPFIPANARFSDPLVAENVAYTATAGKCGGAADGIWAMDLSGDARPVTSFKTAGSPIGAVALTTDGKVVAVIGRGAAGRGASAGPGSSNAVVVLEPKTLQVKDWFSDSTIEFASQPLVFKQSDKDVIAVATTNGRVVLLDAASPGGANHSTPLAISEPIAGAKPEAMATWQERSAQTNAAGTRWLLLNTASGVHALKVVDEGGKPTLQSGWASRDIPSASTPIIVNGVVFDVARGRRTSPAVLYALDGATGKELWGSGKTLTSSMSGRSFWSSNSQVYVGTLDGTIYAFGFLLERR